MSLSHLELKIYGPGGRACKTSPPPRKWRHCHPVAPGSLKRLEFYELTSELQVNLQPRPLDASRQKAYSKGEN